MPTIHAAFPLQARLKDTVDSTRHARIHDVHELALDNGLFAQNLHTILQNFSLQSPSTEQTGLFNRQTLTTSDKLANAIQSAPIAPAHTAPASVTPPHRAPAPHAGPSDSTSASAHSAQTPGHMAQAAATAHPVSVYTAPRQAPHTPPHAEKETNASLAPHSADTEDEPLHNTLQMAARLGNPNATQNDTLATTAYASFLDGLSAETASRDDTATLPDGSGTDYPLPATEPTLPTDPSQRPPDSLGSLLISEKKQLWEPQLSSDFLENGNMQAPDADEALAEVFPADAAEGDNMRATHPDQVLPDPFRESHTEEEQHAPRVADAIYEEKPDTRHPMADNSFTTTKHVFDQTVYPGRDKHVSARPTSFGLNAQSGEPNAANRSNYLPSENPPIIPNSGRTQPTASGLENLSLAAKTPGLSALSIPDKTNGQVGSSAEWAQAMGEKLLWIADKNLKTAYLELNPPEWGKLAIQLDMRHGNDSAHVHFVTAHDFVKQTLEQHMGSLQDWMQQHGIQLTDAQVSQQHSGDGKKDGQPPSGEQAATDTSRNATATEAEKPKGTAPRTRGTQMVDFYA